VSLTTVLIALAAVAVSTGLLLIVVGFVWWLDRYDREPLHLVAAVFLWGALVSPMVSGISVAALGRIVEGTVPAESLGMFGISFFGPFVEETIKAIGVLLVVLLTDKFDNPTDGVVYGTAVGLGFAVTENFFFALGAIAESSGTGDGYAVLSPRRAVRVGWSLAGLVLAVALHSAWNTALLYVGPFSPDGKLRGWLAVLPSLYVVYVIILTAFLSAEHRILKRELAEEVDLMLAPAWVVDVIPYYSRRVRGNWWPSRTERTVIARLLTRVAFRKHSLRRLPQDEATIASLELVKLRQRVREILGPPESH